MEAEARLSKPQLLGPGNGPPQASAEAPAQQMQGYASGRAQLQAETGSHTTPQAPTSFQMPRFIWDAPDDSKHGWH